jgi:hypothetical protein
MLNELCDSNYVTSNGLLNEIDDIFYASTTYNDKTIIWVRFQNSKIGTLIKKIYNHCCNNNIASKWTPNIEHIMKDIRVGKTQSFTITRI